jgi:putative DNA primase/helicase
MEVLLMKQDKPLTPLGPEADSIPEELKTLRQWVAWQGPKIPINPISGKNAASNNPETWGTFDHAWEYYEQHKTDGCHGIGFMFSPNDPYTGIDLDKCIDPETGEIESWAKQIIDQMNSYTELSPSGTGVHVLVRGELPPEGNRKGKIEMYSHSRYFTVTGNHFDGTPGTIEQRGAELKVLRAQVFTKIENQPLGESASKPPVALSDQDIITKAKSAANGEKFTKLWQGDHSGHPSQSEADLALCLMLAFWTGKDAERIDRLFRQSGLIRDKWDEKHYSDGRTYGQAVVQQAVTKAQEIYTATGKPGVEEIIAKFEDVTADTPRTDVLKRLANLVPTLAELSHLDAATVLEELKTQGKITDKNIRALEKDVKVARKEKKEEPKTEITYIAYFDGLVDLVEDIGESAFLIKEKDNLIVVPNVERDGVMLVPPPKKMIPLLLPNGQAVLNIYQAKESDETLYDDLKNYHKGISELPGEVYYDLITAWDFHTYLMEDVQYSPIICFFAVPERGKTRTGNTMRYLSYRGIHVESLREPYIFRMATNYHACIFFDVMDIWSKARKSGSEDILLHRFEKGLRVPRVANPDRGAFFDTTYYEVFGPTIIATNVPANAILDSRGIQINMPQSSRRFDEDVTEARGLPFKERLIAFRARHLGNPLPEVQKPAPGRLGDILRPLLQIIRLVKPSREVDFMGLVDEIQNQRKIEKAGSFEAQILLSIIKLKDKVQRGVLPVQTITDELNQGKPERYQFSAKRISGILRSLGIKVNGKTGTGAAGMIWNEVQLDKILANYGLKEDSIPSVNSEKSAKKVSDDSDVSDDWGTAIDKLI